MPIHLLAPKLTTRPKNPAEDFLANPKSLILGVTFPKYEDKVIDDENLNAGVPLTVSQPPPKGEKDPKVQVVRLGNCSHHFSWEISLPPDPQQKRWITPAPAAWDKIKPIIKQVGGAPPPAQPPKAARLELVPKPTAAEIFNHIKFHEMQHAVDHRWLVQKIFGPWDAWVATTSKIDNPFRAKASSFDWIVTGGKRGAAPFYYIRYYRAATDEIGASYHHTDAGSPPIIKYSGTVTDPKLGPVAQFDLSMKSLIKAQPDFMKGHPHRYFDLLSVHDFAAGERETVLSMSKTDPVIAPYTVTQRDIDEHERGDEDSGPGFDMFT